MHESPNLEDYCFCKQNNKNKMKMREKTIWLMRETGTSSRLPVVQDIRDLPSGLCSSIKAEGTRGKREHHSIRSFDGA